jgi:threonine dehydratase
MKNQLYNTICTTAIGLASLIEGCKTTSEMPPKAPEMKVTERTYPIPNTCAKVLYFDLDKKERTTKLLCQNDKNQEIFYISPFDKQWEWTGYKLYRRE